MESEQSSAKDAARFLLYMWRIDLLQIEGARFDKRETTPFMGQHRR